MSGEELIESHKCPAPKDPNGIPLRVSSWYLAGKSLEFPGGTPCASVTILYGVLENLKESTRDCPSARRSSLTLIYGALLRYLDRVSSENQIIL